MSKKQDDDSLASARRAAEEGCGWIVLGELHKFPLLFDAADKLFPPNAIWLSSSDSVCCGLAYWAGGETRFAVFFLDAVDLRVRHIVSSKALTDEELARFRADGFVHSEL